ncbi:uncharacterized protein LOC113140939 [Mastacembelus armatus]|uniref:uncharacterized protein LOC113140939 n=1 Tax=Mastacembelus armatus TaxID=205130 RepID=UPI000E45474E|nr:uncharacterized protein LOC113140939 [Mastacembelus armatus]
MKPPAVSLLLGVSVLLLSGLTVSAGSLQVQIPSSPVLTGSDVTLHCLKTNGDIVRAYFYVNETRLGNDLRVGFTISKVQQSDEGLYWCATDESGSSPRSWLRVKDPPPTTSDPPTTSSSSPTATLINSSSLSPPSPPPPPPPVSVVRLLCHLLVFSPYCVCTVLMVSICCSRKTGNKPAVSMEMTQHGDEYDDITADVTTVHDLRAE